MRKISSSGLGLQGRTVETTENLTCIKTSYDFRLGSKLANLGRVVAQIISYADCSALEGYICGCIIVYSSVMTNQRCLLEFSTAAFPSPGGMFCNVHISRYSSQGARRHWLSSAWGWRTRSSGEDKELSSGHPELKALTHTHLELPSRQSAA